MHGLNSNCARSRPCRFFVLKARFAAGNLGGSTFGGICSRFCCLLSSDAFRGAHHSAGHMFCSIGLAQTGRVVCLIKACDAAYAVGACLDKTARLCCKLLYR